MWCGEWGSKDATKVTTEIAKADGEVVASDTQYINQSGFCDATEPEGEE
jgi:hypothetical protein